MYVYYLYEGDCSGLKTASSLLKLELYVTVVIALVVLGTEPRYSARAVSALKC